MIDYSAIVATLTKFVENYGTTFYNLSQNESKGLELASGVAISDYYKSKGFEVTLVNPKKFPTTFVIKAGTRGDPDNFSRIDVSKNQKTYEIHLNLSVRSAHDEGIYCVDVGVTNPEAIRKSREKLGTWQCVENSDLVTFAEVKKLVVYPMLLAQFIGIVNEIKPAFLQSNFEPNEDHIRPTLISLGKFSGNSRLIVENYKNRRIDISIVQDFDTRLALLRAKKIDSVYDLSRYTDVAAEIEAAKKRREKVATIV